MSARRSRPHVLFVAPSAYRLGGLATWLDYLLPGLENAGWRATLGLAAGPNHQDPQRYLAEHPWHDVVSISCRTGTERGRRNAVRHWLLRLRPDIVCAVNIPDALAAGAELRQERRIACRLVMTCHGIQADGFEDMRILACAMDAIVCTNRLASALARRATADDPLDVQYAPYGVQIPRKGRTRENDAPLTLAYVGRFAEDQKRLMDCVHILRRLRARGVPFQFVVAGAGPDEQTFRNAVSQVLPPETLVWLGRLSPSQLNTAVYEIADVLLLTSSWETGPIVAWEAMAHGLVLVSSRYIGSSAEQALRHRENAMLFDVGETEAAVDALQELAMDYALWSRLSQEGRRLVEERYTVHASVARWDAVLRRRVNTSIRPLAAPRIQRHSGRLDRWLGSHVGERVRRWLPRTPRTTDPGDEWPHTLANGTEDPSFWQLAAAEDRSGGEPVERR